MDATLLQIDVDLIDPNPEQPRVHFDENKLRELGQSIVEHGLEQAITVEITDNGRYILRDGERRLRAHKMMGLENIMAIVKIPPSQDTERERLIGAFVANFQREALNPVEEAQALKRMNVDLKMTYTEIGQQLGMKKSTVANKVRLLNLPDVWLDAVAAGQVSERQAAAFLPWVILPEEIKWETVKPVELLWDETIREGKSSEQIRRELSRIILFAGKSLDRVVFYDEEINYPSCVQPVCRGCSQTQKGMNRLVCVNLACFARKTEHFRLAAAAFAEQHNLALLPDGTEWWECTLHYNYTVDNVLAIPCPNRAVLASPVPVSTNAAAFAPGVYLVCTKRSCKCQQKIHDALYPHPAPEDKPTTEPVKPFWLEVRIGANSWTIAKKGRELELSNSDILELVDRYCDTHSLVLRAKPDDDPDPPTPPAEPKTLTELVREHAEKYRDEKNRTWQDIPNPSHTNGQYWQDIRQYLTNAGHQWPDDSKLKFAIKQAFAMMKRGDM